MARRNRPTSIQNAHSPSLRAEVAHAAARLMAEDGIADYGQAKRKALKQLGLPQTHPLPPNSEVEEALRAYQALYQEEEHGENLRELRETAVVLMRMLGRFNPHLTGSVLDGTAGRHSAIDLQLFADSAKDVEIFLLNEGISFEHGTPRNDRVEAVFVIDSLDFRVNLIVLPPQEERVTIKTHDGRTRERARIDVVEALLTPT
jgi:hypothetical protein